MAPASGRISATRPIRRDHMTMTDFRLRAAAGLAEPDAHVQREQFEATQPRGMCSTAESNVHQAHSAVDHRQRNGAEARKIAPAPGSHATIRSPARATRKKVARPHGRGRRRPVTRHRLRCLARRFSRRSQRVARLRMARLSYRRRYRPRPRPKSCQASASTSQSVPRMVATALSVSTSNLPEGVTLATTVAARRKSIRPVPWCRCRWCRNRQGAPDCFLRPIHGPVLEHDLRPCLPRDIESPRRILPLRCRLLRAADSMDTAPRTAMTDPMTSSTGCSAVRRQAHKSDEQSKVDKSQHRILPRVRGP